MSKDLKRQRRARDSGDEDQPEKKQRVESLPLEVSSELAQAINVELSKTVSTKRARSKSNEPSEKNVRARMTIDLSSSNPEPTTFLMETIASELENISQMLSPNTSRNTGGRLGGTSLSSSSSSRSHSSPSSTASSPDYYDRLVSHGYELMDRMRQDPSFAKYI